jgi:hypothetical protein
MLSTPLRGRRGGGSWILKLAPPEFPRLVENEALFLAAAKDCGLDAPEFRVVRDRDGNAGFSRRCPTATTGWRSRSRAATGTSAAGTSSPSPGATASGRRRRDALAGR